MITDVFHKQRFLHDQESFPQANIFSWSRYFSTSKNVFYKARFFLDQGSLPVKIFSTSQIFIFNEKFFPQAKTFLICQHFSLIKEVFQKQNIFPQAKVFSWSRKFSTKSFPSSSKFPTNQDFFLIKESFNKDFSFTMDVSHKQKFFLDQECLPTRRSRTNQNSSLIKIFFHKQKRFPQTKIFSWPRKFFTNK